MNYSPDAIKNEIHFEYMTFQDIPDLSFNIASGKQVETDTKIMVINRINRLKYCNLEIFEDDNDEGFKHWTMLCDIDITTGGENCLCGMELKKECYYIKRQHIISKEWYGMRIGNGCIKQLNKYYGTNLTNKSLKKCKCSKSKKLKDLFCKKCIKEKAFEEQQKEKMKLHLDTLEQKVIQYPYSDFYQSLYQQYKSKGFLSDKQLKYLSK